jgi:hypothetical protein
VAARAVAERLADLATGPASAFGSGGGALVSEIAGPREESLVGAAERLVAHRGDVVKIQPVHEQDEATRELYESGALLPGPDAILAGPTFEEWLRTAS